MVTVAAGSINLGQLPFTLYAPDHSGQLVTFCREGFPITESHLEVLSRRDRNFYITTEDQDAYIEYAYKRIDKIIEDPTIRVADKAKIIHGAGKRTVRNLLDSPRSGRCVEESEQIVGSYIDLIVKSAEAASSLFDLSAHDSYSFSHAINVATFCLLVGERLFGDDRGRLEKLGLAGLMHDVGMTQVDSRIIFKPGALTDAEMAQVRRHPIYSEEIIKEHGLAEEVAFAGRSHHERADGSGYPDGLYGNDIPLFARITALADVYDAITSNRSYRKQRSHIDALTIIASEKELYDYDCLMALLEVVIRNERLIGEFCAKHGITFKGFMPSDEPPPPGEKTPEKKHKEEDIASAFDFDFL